MAEESIARALRPHCTCRTSVSTLVVTRARVLTYGCAYLRSTEQEVGGARQEAVGGVRGETDGPHDER